MQVLLNVGGIVLETRLATLEKKIAGTPFFEACFSAAHKHQVLFLDENVDTFRFVMEWIREGLTMRTLCVPKLRKIQQLAIRLGLTPLAKEIQRYLYPKNRRRVQSWKNMIDLFVVSDKTSEKAKLFINQLKELMDHQEFPRLLSRLSDDERQKSFEQQAQDLWINFILTLFQEKLLPKEQVNPASANQSAVH